MVYLLLYIMYLPCLKILTKGEFLEFLLHGPLFPHTQLLYSCHTYFVLTQPLSLSRTELPQNRSHNICRNFCRMEHVCKSRHYVLTKHQFSSSKLSLFCISFHSVHALLKTWNIIQIDAQIHLMPFIVHLT